MLRVEVTEENGIKDGVEHYLLGDICSAKADNLAKWAKLQGWCDAGWAKNCETGETGERTPGAQKLQAAPVVQGG